MAEQPNILSVLVLPFFLKLLQEVESKKKKNNFKHLVCCGVNELSYNIRRYLIYMFPTISHTTLVFSKLS